MRLTFSGTELKSDYHTIIKGTRKKRKREFNSPLAFCYLAPAPLSSLKKWLKISACTSRREKYYAKASVYYLRNDSAGNWIREMKLFQQLKVTNRDANAALSLEMYLIVIEFKNPHILQIKCRHDPKKLSPHFSFPNII